MSNKSVVLFLLLISIGTVTLMSCSRTLVGQVKDIDGKEYIYDENKSWIPAWVMGKLPYSEQGGYRDALQAVGASAPLENPELARKRAVSEGRVQLARIFGLKVQNLIKEWTQEHTDYFDGSGNSSIIYYEEVGRQLTNADLVGSQIDIIWVHPKTNMTYALISISRSEALEEAISRMKEIARQKKTAFVEGKVDQAMDELDQLLKETAAQKFYESGTVTQ